MRIEEVKERTNDNYKNNRGLYSPFVLADYITYSCGEFELTEAIPLENKSFDIEIDKDSLILTDTLGNVLLRFVDCHTYSYSICYVNSSNIIIKKKNKKLNTFEITSYQYDHITNSLTIVKTCPRVKKFVTFPEDESCLIKTDNKDKICRLYSLRTKEELSPNFKDMEVIDTKYGKTIKFYDEVKSNEHRKRAFSGFIDPNGLFHDTIYDIQKEDSFEVDLNSHPMFLQYNALKRKMGSDGLGKEIKKVKKL